jgi:peptide/nickel transport system substrate-binding protein
LNKAIDLALDRKAIMQAATGGYAVLSGLVTPALSEYALPQSELEQLYERDVERAKELLAEAGFPDGLEIELQNIGGYDALTAGAQVVVENLKDIGIDAEIVTLELGQWIDLFVQREYGITMNSGSGQLDPDVWFRYLHSQPLGVDWQSLNDPDFDAMTEEIRTTVDIDERIKLVKDLQRKVIEKGALIILYSPLNVEITQDTVKGYQPHPTNWSYNFDAAWLDE